MAVATVAIGQILLKDIKLGDALKGQGGEYCSSRDCDIDFLQ